VTTPDVRVLGLYGTLAGPVQVAKGREWSLFLSPGDDRRDSADGRRRLLFDAGAALRAHHMKVGNLYGTPCALNQVTDEFAWTKPWRSWREPTPITGDRDRHLAYGKARDFPR
jgi:hypothetical protein